MSIVNVYHGAERLDTSSGKFYIERDGSMVEFSPKVRPEVWDSETLAYIASVQSVVKTDTLSVNATFPETQAVSVATLPLPESAATSAKQLADNHQVTVSNFPSSQAVTGSFYQTTQPVSASALPLPSGAATSDKQDSQLVYQATLESLILTIQELVARLSVLSSWASSGAPGMRVVGVSMPSTAVTGPLTSAQHLANELTKRMATENMAAVLSNVNNCVGK